MDNNKLPEEKIDDFIMGLLNKEDDKLFRKRLQNEPALAEQVTLRREMISGLEAFGRKDLKEELKGIHQEVVGRKEPIAKRRSLFPYIAAAASVLILLVALSWLMNRNTVQTTQDLYASHFEPYDISGVKRDGNEEAIIIMKQLYTDGKYSEVLPLLEAELEKPEAKFSELSMAIGISNLEQGQPEKAIKSFEKITLRGDSTFANEVSWYTALAYLKLEDVEKAIALLDPLAKDTGADHHEEAKELLKKLENF